MCNCQEFALGQFLPEYNLPGYYVEIVNSWGYAHGYEGLQYIRVGDEQGNFINNHNIFDEEIDTAE